MNRPLHAIGAIAALASTPGIGSCVPVSRRASLADFEAALAANDSATTTLEHWCARLDLANPPAIHAIPMPGDDSPPAAELLAKLDLAPGEHYRLRNVELVCGSTVLSRARNWYVPGRLTAAMNRALETGAEPFGRVVAATGFRRERLASRRGQSESCPPGTVLSQHARLIGADGRPISLLVECYTAAILGV